MQRDAKLSALAVHCHVSSRKIVLKESEARYTVTDTETVCRERSGKKDGLRSCRPMKLLSEVVNSKHRTYL